jgi:2-polyprenyl-3-methyl-5-hydroxy-6-metoxy-1,4-benzoquinol methylase
MPDFSKRSAEIEVMDDLSCSGQVVDQTLEELEFINKWLGGNAVTLDALQRSIRNYKSTQHAIEIADLGCGSGDMLRLVTQLFRKNNISLKGIGIDANPNIIDYARKKSLNFTELEFEPLNILSDDFQKRQYDIVIATLFFHHFSSGQLIDLFKSLKVQARQQIIINDLHRHWLAYYAIKFLTGLFSRSSMVKSDAPTSVLRGFSKKELVSILTEAGIENYQLKWRWAFRWQLIIETSSITLALFLVLYISVHFLSL